MALTTSECIREFQELREQVHKGDPCAIEKQHERGKPPACERVQALLDPGSLTELDASTTHRASAFGMEKWKLLGDSVITGYGTIVRTSCLHLFRGFYCIW